MIDNGRIERPKKKKTRERGFANLDPWVTASFDEPNNFLFFLAVN